MLISMLLNELQNQTNKVSRLEERLARLEARDGGEGRHSQSCDGLQRRASLVSCPRDREIISDAVFGM